MGEQPLAGYTRKGFLRGRAVRLMTVTVRPGRTNAAASGCLPGIIREPLPASAASWPGKSLVNRMRRPARRPGHGGISTRAVDLVKG